MFIIHDLFYDTQHECKTSGEVFDFLRYGMGVNEEEAIEASSWCDLAYDGEIYENEVVQFVIEVRFDIDR